MHDKKLSLTVWFWTAYLTATHSNGISAFQLWKQLGLGSYKSAWLLSAKLLRAMVDPERNPLSNLVEIDETSINHRIQYDPVADGQGRSHDYKMLITGAVEIIGRGPDRIRLAHIDNLSAASLHTGNIDPATTAKTAGWAACNGMPAECHKPHVVGSMAAHVILPWIHRVFSNLKTWALSIYHGIRSKHLQSYFGEFVFRFNRRQTRHAAFRSLLGIEIKQNTLPTTC
jgi:hypothetical protein